MKNTLRYIVTDVASIPVVRIAGKGETYKYATKPGWGVVEWYSPANNYKMPVNRDRSDKTQEMYCDEDTSATLFSRYGQEFVIAPYEEINLRNAPSQSETEAIIISTSCGFDFWEKEKGDVKFFITRDENELIDAYRLDSWAGKPYEWETEIAFDDLQSEEEHDSTDRADIIGTFEYDRKMNLQKGE